MNFFSLSLSQDFYPVLAFTPHLLPRSPDPPRTSFSTMTTTTSATNLVSPDDVLRFRKEALEMLNRPTPSWLLDTTDEDDPEQNNITLKPKPKPKARRQDDPEWDEDSFKLVYSQKLKQHSDRFVYELTHL